MLGPQEFEQLVIQDNLQPNTKLPPEPALAKQLGVSRTVLREAVRILVTKGLLETKHGLGTTVRELTTKHISQPLDLLLKIRGKGNVSFHDVYHVRSLLEVEIAGLAALKGTKKEIRHLNQLMVEMESLTESPEKLSAGDAQFHHFLAKMRHNSLLGGPFRFHSTAAG